MPPEALPFPDAVLIGVTEKLALAVQRTPRPLPAFPELAAAGGKRISLLFEAKNLAMIYNSMSFKSHGVALLTATTGAWVSFVWGIPGEVGPDTFCLQILQFAGYLTNCLLGALYLLNLFKKPGSIPSRVICVACLGFGVWWLLNIFLIGRYTGTGDIAVGRRRDATGQRRRGNGDLYAVRRI